MSAMTQEQHDFVDKVKRGNDILTVIGRVVDLTPGGDKHKGICPFHADRDPSFYVYPNLRDAHYHCYGCSAHGDVIDFVQREHNLTFWQTIQKLAAEADIPMPPSVKGVTPLHRGAGVTLEELARMKRLEVQFLNSLGVRNARRNGIPTVLIPHADENSKVIATLTRLSLAEEPRFSWPKNSKVSLYGLNRIAGARKQGRAIFVEGASDCWAAWQYHLPVFGIPGKGNWKAEWAGKFRDIPQLFVWVEPDADELPQKMARDFPGLRVISAPEGIKDLSEAHILGLDLVELLDRLCAEAVPASDMARDKGEASLADLEKRAAPVLAAPDALSLVKAAIKSMGYGGDTAPVEIVYLAATSRLLSMRRGSMPVHIGLIGNPSSGKTFVLGTVNDLLPFEAYHIIDAGSPAVLIYDDADLRHRVLEFGEIDSLPTGEDSPAASAVRSLLQDHRLRYKVVVRDTGTGQFTVKEIDKAGPTVLITTSTRKPGDQLASRLFELEVPDDQAQIRAALGAQAEIEMNGTEAPPDGLIAYQGLLQAQAPWDVVVPFAGKLAQAIGKSPAAPRITRDYARLLSLTKSVTVLRHRHRKRDDKGRLVAYIDDYRKVYELVGDMYAGSVTGASRKVRDVVEAVKKLRNSGQDKITVTMIGQHVGINKMAASRRVNSALKGGWLVDNLADKKQQVKNLDVGEPMPPAEGLPSPEELDYQDPYDNEACNSVTPFTERYAAGIFQQAEYSQNGTHAVEGEDKNTPVHVSVKGVTPLHAGDGDDEEGGNEYVEFRF